METTVSSDGTMGFGSDLFYTYQISSILIYNLIKNSFDYHNTYQHKNHFYISFYKNIFTPSKKQYKSTTTCKIINQKIKKKLINSQSIFQIPQLLSYDAKEYYHFSEVVDEFCKNGWTILNQMF